MENFVLLDFSFRSWIVSSCNFHLKWLSFFLNYKQNADAESLDLLCSFGWVMIITAVYWTNSKNKEKEKYLHSTSL